jgi:single-stranded-DNA-specific exonuclease
LKKTNARKKIKYGKWQFFQTSHEEQKQIASTFNLHPITAQVLINRGLRDAGSVSNFFNPRLTLLQSPWEIKGMEEATAIIKKNIEEQKKILVFGDYDVDGVTGVSLLFSALKTLGGRVFYYIPHREKEGYGLNKKVIQACHKKNFQLIITVDCGITAIEEIKLARHLGLEVVITDHHRPAPKLPEASAIVNPKTAPDVTPACRELSGVGVVLKLVQALSEKIGAFNWENHLDLVALGTVSDIVPLTGENRILVTEGLKILNSGVRPGIRQLSKFAGLLDLDTYEISYLLGPRLNAAGRLDHARTSIELLLTKEEEKAALLARKLDLLNRERQQICSLVREAATELIEKKPEIKKQNLLILEGEHWHPGVIGIVASQLAEEYAKPVIIIALDGTIGRGSGRSWGDFDIHEIFSGLENLFINFGGHRQAIGFQIERRRLEILKNSLEERTAHLNKDDFLPALQIEAEITLHDARPELVAELSGLAPFGEGNPVPVLAASRLKPIDYRLINNRHLKLSFAAGTNLLEAIGFDMAEDLETVKNSATLDLAFILENNNYGRRGGVQLNLRSLRPAE